MSKESNDFDLSEKSDMPDIFALPRPPAADEKGHAEKPWPETDRERADTPAPESRGAQSKATSERAIRQEPEAEIPSDDDFREGLSDSFTTQPPVKARSRSKIYHWVALLLLIAASAVGWQMARRHFVRDNFGVVEPGLIYRSGQLRPFQLEQVIKQYNIKTILKTNIPELSMKEMAQEQIVCNRNNVKIVPLIMPGDGRGEFEQYDQAFDILSDPRNLPALITCARGTHRTGAIVAVYRVRAQSWPIRRVFMEMENYRFKPFGNSRRRTGEEHPLRAHLRAYFKERTGYDE